MEPDNHATHTDLSMASWIKALRRSKVVAVATVEQPDAAEHLATALLEGGVDLLELTLRTPAALDCIGRIRSACPDMCVGAGTVLNPDQVRQIGDVGAQFGVAPGLNPRVVEAARDAGLPFAPGVFTPSDIEQALELGCPVLKFFPAATQATTVHFRTTVAPYLHRGVLFIPLGGLTAENAPAFLKESGVIALGGSWITSTERIRNGDWKAIRDAARAVRHQIEHLSDRIP
jgi:2-dehydro-3-deoxyphosphogluconate aldolase/(4S)-4-hydroxy-2-oxoglutarate aldolase